MRNLYKILSIGMLLLPLWASASTTIPWQITNTSDTYIIPTLLNGVIKGIISAASSTIGSGTQIGGLTISGGATTTGNAYIGGTFLLGTTTRNTISATNPATAVIDAGTSASEEGLDVLGNTNDFYELNVQNLSSAANAQSCITATGNTGSATTNFLSGCVNSTTFNNPTAFNAGFAGDTNLISLANNFYLAQGTVNKKLFVLNGGVATSSIAVTFDSTGGNNRMGIGTTTPFAMLAIHAPATSTLTTLFAIASSTATATATLFSVSNVGTTTLGLFGACNTTNALTTDASGNITCGAISGSGGAAFPFTPTTFNTQPANSTSTLIGFTKGLYAQKQVFIDPSAASATSTLASLEINQTPGVMALFVGSSTSLFEVDGATGFTAIGSTSPFARLSIHANPTQGYANTLFAIGSSTPTATSTLFKIEANGSTTLALASTSVTSQSGFSVTGPGTTTELLGVHCDSGAVCNTGLRISNQTSTIVQLDAAGTGTSAQMNICTRGNINSCINLTTNSTAFSNSSGNTLSMNNSNISYTPPAARTSATPNHIFSYSALTAGTVGVSSPSMTFGSQTAPTVLTHSNGITPYQADVVYWPFKEANTTYNATNEITRAVGISIPVPPLTNLNGNVKLPYAIALQIGSSTTNANFSLTATTTNAIGLEIDTAIFAGAANILAASTTGRWVMNGLGAFVVGDSAVCQRVASGEITVDSGVSSCIVSSKFVKDDQGSDDYQAAFARIQKLRPVLFKYKDSGKEDIGLYAEEVAKVDPRYAQYTGKAKDLDGHHFNAGDPTAINWSAIQTDMLLVLQHQTFGTLAMRSVEENYQWDVILLLVLWNLYLTIRKRRD